MTALLPAGFSLSEPDWHTQTDDQIAESVAFWNVLTAEVLPDDPPGQVEDAIASWRAIPGRMHRSLLRVHDAAGVLVAGAGFGYDPEHDDNPDLLWFSVGVAPQTRRLGLGSLLLSRLLELAHEHGRSRLVSSSNDIVTAGAAFASSVGAHAKQAMHLNHLPTTEVDRALLQTWIDEGPGRAPGYELIGWDGRCPEQHVEDFIDCVLVLNTAPRDDLKLNDFTLTPEQFREQEAQYLGIGVEPWVLVARRRSDGVLVGVHDVYWHASQAEHINVGATGVRPEDRGHALGKWLKAAMTMRVLDERPGVKSIRTGNADSNDAMLGINKAMGYRPLVGETTWEISVAEAEAWLATRS